MAPARSAGAIVAALSAAVICYLLRVKCSSKKSAKPLRQAKRRSGLVAAIGNTPLIRISCLSDATGCEILGKADFLNPGGSVKDRVAVKIIEEALESGALAEGGVVTEGSAGSTAISLATVAPAYGCKCHVVIPDDAAIEKVGSPDNRQLVQLLHKYLIQCHPRMWKLFVNTYEERMEMSLREEPLFHSKKLRSKARTSLLRVPF